MKTARFVVFQDKKKHWRWHLKAANGRVIAQGEAHTRKADAIRAYKAVMLTAANMHVRNFFDLSKEITVKQVNQLVPNKSMGVRHRTYYAQ